MFDKKIKKIVKIDGISCSHCMNKIKNALLEIDGIVKVKVDNEKAIIYSIKEIDNNLIKKTISDLGYKVVEI